MVPGQPSSWYHSNRYTAANKCEYCAGVIRHEPWCATRNRNVLYAYEAALDHTKLSESDRLALHALGVLWSAAPCSGKCSRD